MPEGTGEGQHPSARLPGPDRRLFWKYGTPLSEGKTFQDPQGLPEPVESPEPSWRRRERMKCLRDDLH